MCVFVLTFSAFGSGISFSIESYPYTLKSKPMFCYLHISKAGHPEITHNIELWVADGTKTGDVTA
jgi:hypothetical protein